MSTPSKRTVPWAGFSMPWMVRISELFAGTIGADDGHDLARGDFQRHAVERLGVAVEEVELVDFEEHAHSSSCSPR